MQMSLSFLCFCEAFLGLPPLLTKRFWTAVCQSSWSQARSIKQNCLLHDTMGRHLDFSGLTDRDLAPKKLITLVEDLGTQGLLSRKEATTIEEAVLRQTTKDGRWPPAPGPGQAQYTGGR
jgi:hypothetical protein